MALWRGRNGWRWNQVGALAEETPQNKPAPTPLDLSQYEPKSMLQVHESHVERAKFPVIDFHTHISVSAKSEKGVELFLPSGSIWELHKNAWP